jgi:branched-chain amino acid transport system substrate-binding protein
MTRMSDSRRLVGWFLAALGLAAVLAGCGGTSGAPKEQPSIHGTAEDQAARTFARLEKESLYQRDRQVIDLAHSLLDYHPDFPRMDEALAMAVAAAWRLEDHAAGVALCEERAQRLGSGPASAPVLTEAMQLSLAERDTLQAVEYLVRAGAADPAAVGEQAAGRAAPLLDALGPDDFLGLMQRHPGAPLRPYLGYRAVGACLAAGRQPEAAAVVADLEATAAASRWTGEARALLANPALATGPLRRPGPAAVQADVIGVVCPLTGRYAVLGNAFVDAALMAAAACEQETGVRFRLQVEDSAGDPVDAALAARRLVREDGCIAMLGALTSAPTVAVALVADQAGVPLVSPTATSDRVWELGAGIFQTNLTSVHETRLLAELAVRVLLKQRFAMLYPDSPDGERLAQLFRDQVETWGGEIVAAEPFPERATDFRGPILAVREKRPEVIFVPASVDQMALLGPQLDFHRVGSLVMGLSSFKSERLVERTGAVLDGVICPDDLALFPTAWTAEFNEGWTADAYPREATGLALRTYQAARMLMDSIVAAGAADRATVTAALQRRLSSRDVDTDGPEPFARSIRVVREGRFVPFPAELFTESWALVEGAAADSLAAAAADSLSAPAGPRE